VDAKITSLKWLAFARLGDERRREVAWKILSHLRRAEMRVRREEVDLLPAAGTRITEDLGFVTCPGNVLSEAVSGVVKEANELVGDVLPRDPVSDRSADASLTELSPESSMVQFALDDKVLAIVSDYLGIVPILAGIRLMLSDYADQAPSASRLFHCDYEDWRQVKVFVAASNVQPENGPLTALTADASRRVKSKLNYRYGGKSFRVPDQRVFPLVTDDEVRVFTGDEGFVTFLDTSTCLHFGSRVHKDADTRLLVQFQYLTPPAFEFLFRYGSRHAVTSIAAAGDSSIRRLALGPSRSGR
jgi:hypothetical protein